MSIDGEAWALTYSFLEIEAVMQVPAIRVSVLRAPISALSLFSARGCPDCNLFRSLLRAKIIDLWWESEDVIFLVTVIATRNYVIHMINNSRDLSVRNGFQKLSRYNARDAACGRLIM